MGAAPTADQGWVGFSRLLVGTTAGLFVLLIGILLAIDPYDTGRTGLLRSPGIPEQYPFTANASRGRDPRFDAAIIGNSHVQMLQPERLDRLTGLAFVSLIMPATWPGDHLDVLRWFATSRARPPRAVVVGIDHFWCLPETGHSRGFPAWLYAADLTTYLAGLVRYRSFEAAAGRLRVLRTGRDGIRPDGYWDYGPFYEQIGHGEREGRLRRLAAARPYPVNQTGSYANFDRLRAALAALPAETAVVLLRPPVYRTALPEPGTPGGTTAERCRRETAAVASGRARTVFLDLLHPGPAGDDPDAFYDHDHYRSGLAAAVETEIAAALARIGGGTPGRAALD